MEVSSIKHKNVPRGSDWIHVDSQTDGQMDEWTDMTMVIVTFKCEDTLKGLNIQFVVIILLFFPKCEK
jgi:hypothetical protein